MSIRLSTKERKELISQLRDMAHPNISFYALMVLSTLIAGYGLLADSTAVVIGAMLVAPLMGPIFGMTLSLIIGDRKLFFDSLLAEATGVVLAILIGVLIGSMPFTPGYGSEILSRTQPTLFDAIVALASGLAGGYVLVNPKINAGIAGVAIATALVPPLAVCGLEIAAANMELALSAFVLFITNFFAILLSAALVFMLAGLERIHEQGPSRILHLLRTFGPGVVALFGLTFFLSLRLVDIVEQRRLRDEITAEIQSQVQLAVKGAEMSVCEVEVWPEKIEVESVVLSWKVFDEKRVKHIEGVLEEQTGRDVSLIIRTYSTHDYDSAGKHYWDSEEESADLQALQHRQEQEELREIEIALQDYLQQLPGAFLKDVSRDHASDNGRQAFTSDIETPGPISPLQVSEMQERIADVLRGMHGGNPRVYLRVRQDSVRYADAEGYIFESAAQEPDAESIALKQQLFQNLAAQMSAVQPGAMLDDLHHRRGTDRRVFSDGDVGPEMNLRIVQATVYSPALFSPAEIAEFERELSEAAGERIWLQFDNFIRAYIDSSGIQHGFTSSGG